MTTIPQRLREIAARLRKPRDGRPWGADEGAADLLDAIAAELEAPVADAVPVVAYGYENTRPTERAPLMMVKLSNAGDQYPELATKLVRQRDHLTTVAALQQQLGAVAKAAGDAESQAVTTVNRLHAEVSALQARIKELEARQVPEGSAPINQEQLSELLAKSFMDGVRRGMEKFAASMVERGLVPSLTHPDTSKEQS